MLSAIVASRNDDHGGNMIVRHNMFINGLYQQANRHELKVELVLVEWNPPQDTVPLAEALSWPERSDYFTARVITVPAELHETLRNSGMLDFYQMIAKNVGIRRAGGEWILATNPDLLFTDGIFHVIKDGLPPDKMFYRAPRVDVDRTAVPPGSIEDQLQFCMAHQGKIHNGICFGGLHTHACGDFTLMHRDGWFGLRAYPELHCWSIHIDSLFLVQAQALGYNEAVLEGMCYHIYHERSWIVNPELGDKYPHITLRHIEGYQQVLSMPGCVSLYLSPENWGFADVDLLNVQTV